MFPVYPRHSEEGIDWTGSLAVFLATWAILAVILLRDAGWL